MKYGPISAGSATLEVQDMALVNGVEAYHFILTATSNAFIDIFFKVRDRIDSYADAGMNHSLQYRKDQKEGKTRKDIRVDFDWDRNESTYVNFDSEPEVASLLPGSFDPLSIFYYSRLLDLRRGEEYQHPVADGQKNMMGILRVIGREKVTVPAGTFDTFVLEPDLQKVEGVFAKNKESRIRIWVSDDAHRLLVKMRSKVVVGSFVAELEAFEGHNLVRLSNRAKSK